MRNRAKCKQCGDIIESLLPDDLVQCRCEEIYVDGGEKVFKAGARDWDNFIRIDDDSNEIQVKVIEKESEDYSKIPETKKEWLKRITDFRDHLKALPEQVQSVPLTHYDLFLLLDLLSGFFSSEE